MKTKKCLKNKMKKWSYKWKPKWKINEKIILNISNLWLDANHINIYMYNNAYIYIYICIYMYTYRRMTITIIVICTRIVCIHPEQSCHFSYSSFSVPLTNFPGVRLQRCCQQFQGEKDAGVESRFLGCFCSM